MKNISLIYKKALAFKTSRPQIPYDENLKHYYTDPSYSTACEAYFLKAMLLVKEFDGVSGPLYLQLKKFKEWPQSHLDDIESVIGYLIDHLETFYSQDLEE